MEAHITKHLKIFCIYDAEGSIIGELTYLFKKIFKNFECSMCNITHGKVSTKKEWTTKLKSSRFNIEALHLDEQSTELKSFTKGIAPCVVASIDGKLTLVMNHSELTRIRGDVDIFFHQLEKKIEEIS